MNKKDLLCLDDKVYLNDNWIDFFLRYLIVSGSAGVSDNHGCSTNYKAIYAFTSHFYTKLIERVQLDRSQAIIDFVVFNYEKGGVSRWTKHLHIFSNTFIIVPINLDNHWSLFVIVRPYLLV